MNNINLFIINNNPNSYVTFKYCFEKNKDINFIDCSYNKINDIKITNPNFYLNIILGGSSALGEAHINKDFYSYR